VKPSRALATLAVAAMTLGLGACVTVFPKRPPSQFYSFGTEFPALQSANAGAPHFNVLRTLTIFTRAAAGDRILTTNGNEAAYIAASQWISPASVLFDEAESRAFDADDGPARLIRPGGMSGAGAGLRLEVQTFEARYPGDLKAAPIVIIRVRATITSMADRHMISDRTFEAKQQVGDNRVGEIVRSFNAATVDVLSQVVAWTDSQGAAVATPTAG
jgi:cholesterol transport system auxiliary component